MFKTFKERIRKIQRRQFFKPSNLIRIFFLSLLVLIFAYTFYENFKYDSGDLNLYVLQADSLLKGKIELADNYKDTAVVEDKYYSPFPPFPSLILAPFVAIFGISSTKVMLISLFFMLVSGIMLRNILIKLKVKKEYYLWILLAFFFGTGYWYTVISTSGVWFFAHIIAVTCLFLAIDEALGKGRGILVGLFLGEAFLSRQVTIYSIVFIIALLLSNKSVKLKITSQIAGLFVSLLLCTCIYLVYNYARFGHILDTGYRYIELSGVLKEKVDKYGLFSPIYVPFNFFYLFLQGFHLNFPSSTSLKGIQTDSYGASLLFASPFVLISLFARWKKMVLISAWISIILMIVHQLFYYNNGWFQINTQRFTLDFLPILVCLIALGIAYVPKFFWKFTIIISIILNILALFLPTAIDNFF